MVEEVQAETFDGEIAAGGTQQLEVEISAGSVAVVMLDNGTTGVSPAQYTMTQDVYVQQIDDYQFYDEVTAETARSWQDPAYGTRMRYTFENTSGSAANYRITVKVFRNE